MQIQQPFYMAEAIVFTVLAVGMAGFSLYSAKACQPGERRWRWPSVAFAVGYACYAVSHYYRAFLPQHHETPLVEAFSLAGTVVVLVAGALAWHGRVRGPQPPPNASETGAV